MILAVAADALQIIVFPLFAEGALSPVDDVLDFGVAAVLVKLLGWHWEFLPAFAPNSYPESIWFPSGRWRSRAFIANGNRTRSSLKKLGSSITRRYEAAGFPV
jgi:hypothetical protein